MDDRDEVTVPASKRRALPAEAERIPVARDRLVDCGNGIWGEALRARSAFEQPRPRRPPITGEPLSRIEPGFERAFRPRIPVPPNGVFIPPWPVHLSTGHGICREIPRPAPPKTDREHNLLEGGADQSFFHSASSGASSPSSFSAMPSTESGSPRSRTA
jgi:hypothetical protein